MQYSKLSTQLTRKKTSFILKPSSLTRFRTYLLINGIFFPLLNVYSMYFSRPKIKMGQIKLFQIIKLEGTTSPFWWTTYHNSSCSPQGRQLKDAEWRKKIKILQVTSVFQIFDGATEQTYLSFLSTRASEIFTETFNLSQEYLSIRFQWLVIDSFLNFLFLWKRLVSRTWDRTGTI